MDHKRPRAGLLCIILLLFISVAVGMLHGRKSNAAGPSLGSEKKDQLGIQDIIDLITPLLISKSFDAISRTLSQFDQPAIVKVLERTISTDTPNLAQRDQSLLFLNIIANIDNASLHKQVYALLKKHHANEPIYVYSLLDNTPRGVERTHKIALKQDPAIAQQWAENAMEYTLELNKPDLLDHLYALGVRISPLMASKLLDKVVVSGKNIAFVHSLVRNMRADPNYSPDGLKTLLIAAVEKKNEPMVRALLEEGADPDRMVDDEIGSALQNAYEIGSIAIEQLLKDARKK